jgi:hypothetical protein
MTIQHPQRPIFVMRLTPKADIDPIKALRMILKNVLRQYGMRCLSIVPETGDNHDEKSENRQ